MNLIADFRLLSHVPAQHVYFAAIPTLLPLLARFGDITETDRRGVYKLELHPLVDWPGLIAQLEAVDGLNRERPHPLAATIY